MEKRSVHAGSGTGLELAVEQARPLPHMAGTGACHHRGPSATPLSFLFPGAELELLLPTDPSQPVLKHETGSNGELSAKTPDFGTFFFILSLVGRAHLTKRLQDQSDHFTEAPATH